MKDFEVVGVFNPGIAEFDGRIQILFRVAEAPLERREGFIALPRMDLKRGGYRVDWVRRDEVDQPDARAVVFKHNGLHRLTFVSHLRLASSHDGFAVDHSQSKPILTPERPYEEFGVEDARVTRIGEIYYVTYVAVSRHGIATALASTLDFVRFERHGIIFPTENKDVVLFPEKIEGEFVALHRPVGMARFGVPEIWLARSSDGLRWGGHKIVISGSDEPECIRVGSGIPPLRLEEGWLEIYHGVQAPQGDESRFVYDARGVILDAKDPAKKVYPRPVRLFEPEHDFETTGFLNNVVFPTGCVRRGDDLHVYYGAADALTAVTTLSLSELRGALSAGRK